MNVEIDLQPCQIVCLENGSDRLYAEVIQVVRSRQVAWVRPLVLVKACPTSTDEAFQVACDLRQGSDLLWYNWRVSSGFRCGGYSPIRRDECSACRECGFFSGF
uniref:Uncharacterized protein n=1 Tax=Desertifilum tharense IPPAS B-1220 TaxID=1781255 RepID=A0ACD5GSL7_9CYAN